MVADVGANATLTVVCCPAFKLRGSEKPLTVKGAPEAVIWEILSVAVPVFLMMSACVVVVPTTSLPKPIGLGLALIAGAFTVSVAALLVTLPAELLTTTSKVEPLSVVAVAGVV